MLRNLSISAALLAVLAATAPADVSDVTIRHTDPGATVSGYLANDVVISISGEWTGAQFFTPNLGGGAFYQDPFGGDIPPVQALVNAFPKIAFDTFLANGTLINDPASTDDVLVVGSSANLGGLGGVKSFTNSQIDVTWAPEAGLHPTDVSDYVIGRFTIRDDVNGTSGLLVATDEGFTTLFGSIQGGVLSVFIHGDINDDGVIDDADLNVLLSGYGKWYEEDGLQTLLSNFGMSVGDDLGGPPQSVPEPSAAVLLLLGVLGMAPLMRRLWR